MNKNGLPENVLNFAITDTAIGPVLVVGSAKGLCALRLVENARISNLLKEVQRENPRMELQENERALQMLTKKVVAVIAGRLPAAEVPLDLQGTPFQKRVWQTLLRVPWGKTYSYTQLAGKAGHPRAVRAVASACARNRIAFVIPCHRIVAKDGGLGGYYWGLDRKRQLLEREQ